QLVATHPSFYTVQRRRESSLKNHPQLAEVQYLIVRNWQVFLVTGAFSLFAYIWLFLVLNVISTNVVELWEAILTFLFFPILIFFAWSADQKWCGLSAIRPSKTKQQLELGPLREGEGIQRIMAFDIFENFAV
ncbi:unnamed protein product, partial [Nesidiocoris tenuis]